MTATRCATDPKSDAMRRERIANLHAHRTELQRIESEILQEIETVKAEILAENDGSLESLRDNEILWRLYKDRRENFASLERNESMLRDAENCLKCTEACRNGTLGEAPDGYEIVARVKNPRMISYRRLTVQEARELRPGDSVLCISDPDVKIGNAIRRAKVNGKPKTWKRSPERVSVPLKYGMYETFHATETGDGFVGYIVAECPQENCL